MAIPTEIKSKFYNSGKYYPTTLNGKKMLAYNVWSSIKSRCYNPTAQAKMPTYRGCSIDERWWDYQEFAQWYHDNSVEGWQIDKDILVLGNKVYGPDTCIFVPPPVNSLLTMSEASRGNYPLGIRYFERDNVLTVQMKIDGNLKHLGSFPNTDEGLQQAWNTYRTAKLAYAHGVVEQYPLTDLIKRKVIECLEYKLEIEANRFIYL